MVKYKDIFKVWDGFFFSPRPTEGIAAFRIVWVLMLMSWFLFSLSGIHDFYGPHAVISLTTAREQFPAFHLNVFHLFQNGYEPVYFLASLFGVALLSSLVGFYTRTSLVIVVICMVSFHQRNIWVLSSSEMLMRAITILLACSPCGHSLSVDSLLGRKFVAFKKERDWAPWASRLIQIQTSVVYLWTVWHKLQGNDWIDGTAVYYASRADDFINFPVPFLLDSMLFIKLATWGTLVVELALGTLIWVKEFRKPVIAVGMTFHLVIEYVMCIPFFEWAMIALLLNFFSPEEYRVAIQLLRDYLADKLSRLSIDDSIKTKLVWAVRGQDE